MRDILHLFLFHLPQVSTMSRKKERPNKLVAKPRYFYFFSFETIDQIDYLKFVKAMGFELHNEIPEIIHDNYETKLLQVVSVNKLHEEGDVGILLNKKSSSYIYDLLYSYSPDLNLHVWCFPLKSIGKSCLSNIIRSKFLSKGKIVIPDIHKFSKLFGGEDIIGDNSSCHLSMARISIPDSALSVISLKGDRPLDTDLYRDTFEKDVEADKSIIVLSTCKMRVNNGQSSRRASITTDKFGASKFYVHFDGVNLPCLPYYMELFYTYDCFEYTSLNPFMLLKDEEI